MGTSNGRRIGRQTASVIEQVERRVLMSGTVLNDYLLAPGKSAAVEDVVEDAAGNLFVAGGAIDASGGHHAQVRQGVRQADGGIAWSATPVIDYSLAPTSTLNGPQSYFYDLMIDAGSGDLYAVGQALDPAGGTDWVVVKRSGADGSVTVLDEYRQPDGASAWANGITRDAAGNLFVVGGASSHWVVRELKAGAQAWETVQDVAPAAGTSSNGNGIVATSSGVFAVGYSNNTWITQRAVPDAAGAVTWTTVDAYKADPNYNASAYGVGADAAGNVYVTGTARRSTGVKQKGQVLTVSEWTVRRSTDGGGTWASIDRFSGNVNHPTDFGTDPAGNLYVCGYAAGADGVNQAVVRWARPGGTGWATLDAWQQTAGENSFAHGFFADHTGALYTAGGANEVVSTRRGSTSFGHAIVRRIDPPAGVSTTFSNTVIRDASTPPEDEAGITELLLA